MHQPDDCIIHHDPEHEGGEGVEDQVAGEDACEGVGRETFKVFAEILPDETDVRDEIVDHKTESDLAKERFVEIGVDDVDEDSGKEEDGGDGQGNWVEYKSEVLKKKTKGEFSTRNYLKIPKKNQLYWHH